MHEFPLQGIDLGVGHMPNLDKKQGVGTGVAPEVNLQGEANQQLVTHHQIRLPNLGRQPYSEGFPP